MSEKIKIFIVLLCVMAALYTLVWIGHSEFESNAYNRVTGNNVSTWEAMFLDLRLTGPSPPAAGDELVKLTYETQQAHTYRLEEKIKHVEDRVLKLYQTIQITINGKSLEDAYRQVHGIELGEGDGVSGLILTDEQIKEVATHIVVDLEALAVLDKDGGPPVSQAEKEALVEDTIRRGK